MSVTRMGDMTASLSLAVTPSIAITPLVAVIPSVAVTLCDSPVTPSSRPLTRGEIEAKFRTYAQGRLPDAHMDEAVAAVTKLEALTSVRELTDVLRLS